MSTEQIFTSITILLTSVNVALIYFSLRQSRRKDFEDKLFQIKLEAYQDLNKFCHENIKRLSINSTPFVEIYDYKDEKEWGEYCVKNMDEQFIKGFELQDLTFKYSLLLPSKIVDKFYDFSNMCIHFVTMSYHFDTGLIINNQDRLWDLYIDLINEFRKDLDIDIIDGGLRQRITSKM